MHECFIYLFILYFLRLKTVDVLIHSLDEAETQVRKYESRLSEEDIVPPDTTAIRNLREQLGVRDTLSHKIVVANQRKILKWNFLPLIITFYCILYFFCFCFISFQKWHAEVTEQEDIFQSLQSEVHHAKEAGSQLSRLHPDRSPELGLYEERANQMTERWSGVKRQMETR